MKNQIEDSGWLSSINSWTSVDYIILDSNHNFPGTGWFDNIYIRKYNDLEPAHGTWFTEEYSDNTIPVITINAPQNGQEFDYAPVYDIEVETTSLNSIWYTLNNGVQNISITELVGTLDQTAWSSVVNGYVTIRFYANNSLGNVGTSFVIVVKTSAQEPPSTPPGIPGYNLIALIGVVSVISAILIRKRLNS